MSPSWLAMKMLSNLKLTFIQRHFSSSLHVVFFSDFIPYALAYPQLSYVKIKIVHHIESTMFLFWGVGVREGLSMIGQ
jgi:hypothetical protein